MSIEHARLSPIDKFFSQHGAALARQGAIKASWRYKEGRRLGPYLRLDVRDESGRTAALYLGRESNPRVADVRARLAQLQHRCKQQRQLARVCQIIRQRQRAWRDVLARELAKVGLHHQGLEVRGLADVKGVFEALP